MPELPEVETLRRQLSASVRGKTIRSVEVHNARVIREPGKDAFVRSLARARIVEILRRGKALIFELSTGKALLIHLKMTGQLVYPGTGLGNRLVFHFDDGTALDFRDRRLFAELRLLSDWKTYPFIRDLGPDPLAMTESAFREMIAKKKTKIKPLLMDQTFVAGIGNLYAAEVLFKAKIHPARQGASLSAKEAACLLTRIQETLREAISYNGSSVDQFLQLSGLPGRYVSRHTVYGRQGKPCPVCSRPVERITLGGRGTYLCSRCQK